MTLVRQKALLRAPMWKRNPYRHVADDAEELATPGPRNVYSVIAFGVIVPLGIAYYALRSWIHESCGLFGSASGVELSGAAAQAMAIGYAGVALYSNARFCWGALGYDLVYKLLVVVACLGFIGGMFSAMVLSFR